MEATYETMEGEELNNVRVYTSFVFCADFLLCVFTYQGESPTKLRSCATRQTPATTLHKAVISTREVHPMLRPLMLQVNCR